eukprot:TRINITY_DN44754_c0_g1_i1.p1 TRINITY_DN44754_c0_g1~~TRINITY_DN44754_c0_g1_i1.p1  ORF type:complete len:407 (+),score=30.25 TRINITY_DN44754_c0_g1_i1:239-1459(+)
MRKAWQLTLAFAVGNLFMYGNLRFSRSGASHTGPRHAPPESTVSYVSTKPTVTAAASARAAKIFLDRVRPPGNRRGVGGWETPGDLSVYFTPEEVLGITQGHCTGKNRLLTAGYPTYMSHATATCCPNGYAYGWFQRPLVDRAPLRTVFNGTRPFGIKRLVDSLLSRFSQRTIRVFIVGDSVSLQLYNGFFCGLARMGATLVSCNVSESEKHLRPGNSVCGSNSVGLSAQFKTQNERVLQVSFGRGLDSSAGFDDSHARSADLVIANHGLRKGRVESVIDVLGGWGVLNRTIWKHTTLQHFPAYAVDGVLHEHGAFNRDVVRDAKSTLRCENVGNVSKALQSHSDTSKLFLKHGWLVPQLATLDAERDMGGFYGPGLDCTHPTYSPVYFDVVFHRLSRLIRAMTFG